MTDVVLLRALLDRLLDGENLEQPEAAELLAALTAHDLAPALAGALLAALRAKGVTADELRGFAGSMRALARKPHLPVLPDAVDIVGTGGDRSGSLNLSTGAPLLAAAGRCFGAVGFTFLFAPYYHAATKSIAPVRAALGVRTVFNLLGPLSNPAAPPYLVIGAFSLDTAELMAQALAGSGIKRAFVIHGAEGWDEPTPIGAFTLFDVGADTVRRVQRTPADYGLPLCEAGALAGADAAHNALELTRVLDGGGGAAHRHALLLGAALALEVTGRERAPAQAIARAAQAIDDGAAADLLLRLERFGADEKRLGGSSA